MSSPTDEFLLRAYLASMRRAPGYELTTRAGDATRASRARQGARAGDFERSPSADAPRDTYEVSPDRVSLGSQRFYNGEGSRYIERSHGARSQGERDSVVRSPRSSAPHSLRSVPHSPRASAPHTPRSVPQSPRSIPQSPRSVPHSPRASAWQGGSPHSPVSSAARAIALSEGRSPGRASPPRASAWSLSDDGVPDTSRWSSSTDASGPRGPAPLPALVTVPMRHWQSRHIIDVVTNSYTVMRTHGLTDCTAVVAVGSYDARSGEYPRALVHLAGGDWDESLTRQLQERVFLGGPGFLALVSGTNASLVQSDCQRFRRALRDTGVAFRYEPTPRGGRGDVELLANGQFRVT